MNHLTFISHNNADREVAHAICHYLEEAGIRCWIAPRDVDSSDWAGSIMKGLHQSDIFVVIISKNSIQSPEVIKEVTEATRCCQYILPFKIDEGMLNDRLQYHLGPCHWMDAVTPPMEERIKELIERIRHLGSEDAIYRNQSCQRLLSNVMLPRSFFIGRETEIDEIHEMLQEEHVLFLQGMGGIGKSEIAKGYAKTYAECYDTVIFANYQGSILDMVIGDDIQIENFNRAISFGKDAEAPEVFYKRKMQVMKELSNERTLLIVDNFDVDEDEYLEDLVNGPYKLLVTTRNEHYDYPVLPIGKIGDFTKVRQIFEKNYGRPIAVKDRETIDEMLELVGCHTITVELIAKQMKASFQTPAKMLALLKSGGVKTNLKEKVKREGASGAKTSFDFIKDLFKLSNLSAEEQHILMCMCLVPHSGIDVPWFGEILGLEDFDVINSLLAKSWLMLDEESGCMQMHPIIYDVVKDELKPDNVKCADYIVGLNAQANSDDIWQMSVEERTERWPYLDHILRNYPTPSRATWREYLSFGDAAWISGQFKQSIAAQHITYDFILKEFGSNTEEAARGARLLAGAYYNSGDNEGAEPYYEAAAEHHRNSTGEPDIVGIGILYTKLGRCAYLRQDYEKAEEYLELSLDYFTNVEKYGHILRGRSCIGHMAGAFIEYERMYMQRGEYEKALEYCQKSYEANYAALNREQAGCGFSLVDWGICYSALGDYEKAEEYLERALKLNIRINGEASLQTVRTKEAIADNYLAQGRKEEAKRLYLQLELELEKNFGADSAVAKQLREKGNAV